MNKEQFKKAAELRNQIANLTTTIFHLNIVKDFKLEPMTRNSGIYLRFGNNERSSIVHISEGEAVCIYEALKREKDRLEIEFESI